MSVPDGTGTGTTIYNRHLVIAIYYFVSLLYIVRCDEKGISGLALFNERGRALWESIGFRARSIYMRLEKE